MKPYSDQHYGPTALPYTVGVTRKNNLIDQKISVHKLWPGYQTTIHVVPKILETTSAFNNLKLDKRECKLPHETTGFRLFNEYSQKTCETECAARKASTICQCMPWNYPNDFMSLPMCDMFGGFCFNQIMSNEVYYKSCKSECLADCKEISLSVWQRTAPLNIEELCKHGSYFHRFFEKNFQKIFAFEHYRIMVQDHYIPDLATSFSNGSLCLNYIRKYVSLVSVESPTENVAKSHMDIRVSFNDQLGIIGGNLGLCVGMSVLGMCEVVMLILITITGIVQDLKNLPKKILSYLRFHDLEIEKEATLDTIVVCTGKEDQRSNQHEEFEEDHEEIKKLYVRTFPIFKNSAIPLLEQKHPSKFKCAR